MRSKNTRSKTLSGALALAGISAVPAFATWAQTNEDTNTPPARVEEILVTGSRLIVNGNDAPTPVTVVTVEQILATKPATLYENLTEIPVFSGSRGALNGPVTTSPNAAGGTQPNGAVSSLNLRNLGPLRTLVLFDGRRVPPISPDGLTDPSTLPQMLVERVEVVTGGVSAVYGSDAVAGVVNFITDSDFTGVRVEAQGGRSQEGDGESYKAGIAVGTELFGGRGHFIGSFQRLYNDDLYDHQRDWARYRWTVQGNGTTVPWQLRPFVTNATATFGGSIACPNGSVNPANCPTVPNVGLTFHQDGVWGPFDPGTRDGLTQVTVQNGGDGAYFINVALRSQQTSDQFFGRFDFELTDNIDFYLAGAWNATDVYGATGTQRTFVPGVNIGACNAFLPAAYQAQLGCTDANRGTASEPTFRFEKQFNPLTTHGMGQNNGLESDNYFLIASLDGRFGDDYKWDVSLTHSKTELVVSGLNQNRQHIYAGLDAVVDPATGRIVCRITLTNPDVLPGCVPLNLFGPTAMTREMAYYVVDKISNTTENELNGFAANLTGSPFNSWVGPVQMALSFDLRRLEMSLDSTSKPTDFLNCTGLRFGNCNPNVPVHPNVFQPIDGVSQTVKEGALEVNVPVLSGLPGFDEVDVNGAVRYAKYDNNSNQADVPSLEFNAMTWKVGLTWDITDTLTLRWTRSRDFRAPSLYDLYLPQAVGNTTNAIDYLLAPQGVPAQPRQVTGGNPFLEPEVGLTSTLGVVWRPTPDFSLSLDAYKISISDALYQLNGSSEPVQRACYASGGSSPTCQLQERALGSFTNTSPNNVMTRFYIRAVNIAQQETSGIDLETSYRMNLFDQPLSLRALVTYQPHNIYYIPFAGEQDVAGVAYPQIGGFPAPVVKASLFLRYQLNDRWTIDVSERYRSRLRFSADRSHREIGSVSPVAYTNLTLAYEMPLSVARVNAFLNVQNLFDKDPPPAGALNLQFPGQFPSNYAVGDDVLGRYFTIGVRVSL